MVSPPAAILSKAVVTAAFSAMLASRPEPERGMGTPTGTRCCCCCCCWWCRARPPRLEVELTVPVELRRDLWKPSGVSEAPELVTPTALAPPLVLSSREEVRDCSLGGGVL